MKTMKIVGLGVAILFVAVWLAPFCSFAHEVSKPSKNLQLAKHSAKNDLLVRKIQTLLRAKRTRDRALALAKKAVSDYPDSGEFHKLLAEAYSYSEENQLSKKHFRLALKYLPKDADTIVSLARIEHRLNNDKEAMRLADQALKIEPKNHTIHYFKAKVYMHRKKDREAVDELTKSIDLYPGFYQARQRRASIYMILKEWKSAIDDYSWLLSGKEKKYKFFEQRGFAYEQIGLLDKAMQDYCAGLKLGPNFRPLLVRRASLYKKLGKNKLAKKDRDRLKSLDKDFVPFSFQPDWTGRKR